MNYLAYHFKVNPTQPGSEILIALISDFGFDSFDYNETGFVAYIKEELASHVDLKDLEFEDFNYTYSIDKIAEINWNAEWEKNFEPVFVDDKLMIRAPFHERNPAFKYEILITPKMSFGTGHHQTTRMMCQEMFAADFQNKRVLDMGCGTGILAILAKQLHASDVLGIDIDEWSVENSLENCAMNNCEDIVIRKGDVHLLDSEKPFDILLANINKNILRADIPHYSLKLVSGGKLFLSGFFTTDIPELKEVAAANGLRFVSDAHENEWAVARFEKI